MRNYDAEIAELQKKLDAAKAEKAKVEAQPIDQKVAEMLHKLQCHWNHTDGCGWEYETWDGVTPAGNSTRAGYLKKAHRLLRESAFANDQNTRKFLILLDSLK